MVLRRFPFPRCNVYIPGRPHLDIQEALRIIMQPAMNRCRMAVMSPAAVFRGCLSSAVIGCYGTAIEDPCNRKKK